MLGGGGLAVLNETGGTINASAAGHGLSIQTGGESFQNQGLIEATGAGGLVITSGSTIVNTGTILAASGNVSLNGGADIAGGLLASTGGTFFTNGATLDGSLAAVTIGSGGGVHVDDGTALTLLGTINAAGTLFDGAINYATALILGSPTVTLMGASGVRLSDDGGNQIYGSSASDETLVNQTTIAGAGQIGVNSGANPLALVNLGMINATGVNVLTIQAGGPAVVNSGLLESNGRGGLTIYNTTVQNAGICPGRVGQRVVERHRHHRRRAGLRRRHILHQQCNAGRFVRGGDDRQRRDREGRRQHQPCPAGHHQCPWHALRWLIQLQRRHHRRLPDGDADRHHRRALVRLWRQPDLRSLVGGRDARQQVDDRGRRADRDHSSASPLALVNDGTINATGANGLIIQTGGPAVVNAGLIESTGKGGLFVSNATTIDNASTILAASGNVTLSGGADVAGGLLASTGGVFFTSNATLDGSQSAVTIGSGASVHVNDGTSLALLGTINAVGTLFDGAGNYNTDIVLGSPIVTLTGATGLRLSDAGGNRLFGTVGDSTLVNLSTIAGAGQIGINSTLNPLTLVNRGTIDATGIHNALYIQTGGPAVSNTGLIEATAAGGLQITNGTTIANSGTILAAGGNVVLSGGADIVGGRLAASGNGFYTSNATLDGTSTPVTIGTSATVHVNDATALTLRGTINGAGTIADGSYNYNTDLVLGSPTVTLAVGAVVLSDSGGNRIYGTNPADSTLVNRTTISGAGQIGINSSINPLALVNDGTIDATGANALVIQSGGPGDINAGLLESTGHGGLTIANGTTIANTGTILAATGNVLLTTGADIAGGVLASAEGTIFTNGATLDGSGTALTIAAGATVHVNDSTGLTLLGTINTVGTIVDGAYSYNTDLILGSPTVTLTGNGGIRLSDSDGNRIYGASAADATLVNDTTIAGAGQIGINAGGNPVALTNNGTIDATGTHGLVIQTGGPAVVNAGLLEAMGSGGLAITNGTTVVNFGTVLAASGNVSLNNGAAIAGGVLASGGGTFFTNNAVLDGSASAVTIRAGAVVHVDDGTGLTLLGTIDTIGTIADSAYNYSTDLILGSPTVTLVGSGGIRLSDSGGNRIYGASVADETLVNDTTIAGAGADRRQWRRQSRGADQ